MYMTDILDEFRIPYHSSGRETRPGWINLRCPFCQRDPYLGYRLEYRYFSCWNCGRHNVYDTLHLLTPLPPTELYTLVSSLPKLDTPTWCESRGILVKPLEIRYSLSSYHKAYLEERNFSPKHLESKWEIGGIGLEGGDLKWRIYIPIFFMDEQVSWTTRALWDRQPRYYAAKDEQSVVPVRNLLYGIDHCRNTVIVVEGPLDAWAIGHGAVALLGQNVGSCKMNQLSKFSNRYVCYDNEPEAQRRARCLVNSLSVYPGTTKNIVLETGKDAAAANKQEIQALRYEMFGDELR